MHTKAEFKGHPRSTNACIDTKNEIYFSQFLQPTIKINYATAPIVSSHFYNEFSTQKKISALSPRIVTMYSDTSHISHFALDYQTCKSGKSSFSSQQRKKDCALDGSAGGAIGWGFESASLGISWKY
jgi:hypothetical protein